MKKLLAALALVLALSAALYAETDFTEIGREAAKKADLAFMWGSDTHHQAVGNYGVPKSIIDDFVRESNDIGVAFAAVTGDLVNGYYDRANQEKDLTELRSWLGGCKMPLMLTMGNHDDNAWFISGQASVKEIGSISELFPKEDFFKVAFGGTEKDFVRDPKNPYGGWFYKDFTKAKIRVIMLNAIDIPYIPKDKGLKYYGQWHYGFGNDQLNWLAGKALKFSKPGWGVIIMTHIDFSPASGKLFDGVMEPVNSDMIRGILDAYQKKEMGTLTSSVEDHEAKIKYNFRNNKSDEFIAAFAGHRHGNLYEYVDGKPHILIGCIFDKARGGFDLVTVDRAKKTVSTRRFLNGKAAPELNRSFVY